MSDRTIGGWARAKRGILGGALTVALIVTARLSARAVGASDLAGLLGLVLLVSVWAGVGFVRSERRREREHRGSRGS